ncbi:MAG: DNA polymerase III subunit alpha [Armatimonadota bacterium]|nr:DNA polymerase III subunit alpha [Armatimonadota bacterium]
MEILARWRESGRWWQEEPETEWVRFLDEQGILREETLVCSVGDSRTLVDDSNNQPRVADAGHTVDYDVVRLEQRNAMRNVDHLARLKVRSLPIAMLHGISALSFGRSTMMPEHLAAYAKLRGYRAAAITDRFSLAGVVDFCKIAKQMGIKPIIGASLEITGGGTIVVLSKSKRGYSELSRLITDCHLQSKRLMPIFDIDGYEGRTQDLVCLTGGYSGPLDRALIRKGDTKQELRRLQRVFDEVYIELENSAAPWSMSLERALRALAEETNTPVAAAGPITHASREDFPAQDALVCAETLCTVEEIAGRKEASDSVPLRWINSERHFREAYAMPAHFGQDAVENGWKIAEQCADDPLPDVPEFPQFDDHPERTLRDIVLRNSLKRYRNVTAEHKYRVSGELDRVCRLGFASHFLAIWEACEWARGEGILFSARGSAVDSAISYCLGFSRIDAIEHNLHFDRFLPADGSKKPDIDVDFESARRDDVRHFFERRYGIDHVATVCAVATYQGRGIVRNIGKALMIPEPTLDFLAKRLHGSISGKHIEDGIENRPELRDSGIPAERLKLLFELAKRIDGLPRQVAAHSSGVVLSATPICETVPVMESGRMGVRIIQWDKYSSKKFFNKFDVLCLRGQDVLAGTEQRVAHGVLDTSQIPWDDPEVFEDFRKGNLIGTPQSASPAMRQAHMRLRSNDLHDVSLVQAGIRPGVGGAVKINELIKRRRSAVPHQYSHPLFEAILGLSYGIIVFQEQVDQLLQAFCGFTSGEAEEIREGIHKRRAESWDETIRDEVIGKCLSNGFSPQTAAEVFDLVSGFKGYGFAQGHALAFADISIRCVYCQQHYPAEYFASLLSAQPAGYYGPGTIANEARIRNVPILPLDVNQSEDKFSVEDNSIRVGLMQQFSLSDKTKQCIIENVPYRSIFDFARKVRPDSNELECLILAGAFESMHPNRRALLWALPDAVTDAKAAHGSLFEPPEPAIDNRVEDFTEYEKAVLERSMLGLDIAKHLMSFERDHISQKNAVTAAHAREKLKNHEKAVVVGHAMRLRFPPTASGKRVVFFDLEDETGLLNVTCFDETYKRDGKAIICSPFVTLRGEAQDRDGSMAFLAHRVFPYTLGSDRAGLALERKAVHAEDFIHRGGR